MGVQAASDVYVALTTFLTWTAQPPMPCKIVQGSANRCEVVHTRKNTVQGVVRCRRSQKQTHFNVDPRPLKLGNIKFDIMSKMT